MLGTNWPRWVLPILRGVGVVLFFSSGGVFSSLIFVCGLLVVKGVGCIWVPPICVGGCSVGGVSLVGGASLSLVLVCGSECVKNGNSSLWVSPIVTGGGFS